MTLRDTVERRLINDYIREHGVPAIGQSGVAELAAKMAEMSSSIAPEQFGSTNYYDIYVELVGAVEYEQGACA